MKKVAFITGITGQDGSYLAELLLEKGYEVHGIIRRASSFNTDRIDHIFDRLKLYHSDMTDGSSLPRLLERIRPDEIYNLAAQSHVMVSYEIPEFTGDVSGLGTLRILEAIRETGISPRFYQASSSEQFGNSPAPQNEETPFDPQSPYAAAKVYAHQICKMYREGYGMHITCGLLFNHESPRRGETFVTRKVCKAAARIKAGIQKVVVLGNLEAKRDWGHARDYVEVMWLMLQQEKADDYVIATGVAHSVRELCKTAFDRVGLDYLRYVRTNSRYLRPNEVKHLEGDASKAWEKLGWKPRVSFEELIHEMVDFEVEEAEMEIHNQQFKPKEN